MGPLNPALVCTEAINVFIHLFIRQRRRRLYISMRQGLR